LTIITFWAVPEREVDADLPPADVPEEPANVSIVFSLPLPIGSSLIVPRQTLAERPVLWLTGPPDEELPEAISPSVGVSFPYL
jgi:hypothetical protein